jgi:hypothetical protein
MFFLGGFLGESAFSTASARPARLDGAIRLRLRIELLKKSNLGGSNVRVCLHPPAYID